MTKDIVKSDLPIINELVQNILGKNTYQNISRMGGMTNRTYMVELSDKKYSIRIPGEGTELLICRSFEKISTQLACQLGIDAELIYFGKDGTKVTAYIQNAITMSPDTMKEKNKIQQAANIFKKLHQCKSDTEVPFHVFEMAKSYENFIHSNNIGLYEDYPQVKEAVIKIKRNIDKVYDTNLVPCHNDPLCENWIDGNGRLYLVDWEYAGMNDSMWDLADLSIEAEYNAEQDLFLLESYLNHNPILEERLRFEANKLYLDYLWTLWGKARVPFDGNVMELYALGRYVRLKDNLKKITTMQANSNP